jgi:hypothetical protein
VVQPVHAYSAYGLRPIMDLLLSLIIWSKLFWAGDGYLKIIKISPAIRNDTAEKRSMILTEGGILFMSFFRSLICERGSGPPRLLSETSDRTLKTAFCQSNREFRSLPSGQGNTLEGPAPLFCGE